MAVFAEMAVETATVSTEERGSGVRLNFIPREGGNTFSGMLISSFANEFRQPASILPARIARLGVQFDI